MLTAAVRTLFVVACCGVSAVPSTASADSLDLLTATVDAGTPVSPLIAGRMLCTDSATVTGEARLTIAGKTVGVADVVAGACGPEWNPLGFRVSPKVRSSLKSRGADRHAVVLVARLTATTQDGASQTVQFSRKLKGR